MTITSCIKASGFWWSLSICLQHGNSRSIYATHSPAGSGSGLCCTRPGKRRKFSPLLKAPVCDQGRNFVDQLRSHNSPKSTCAIFHVPPDPEKRRSIDDTSKGKGSRRPHSPLDAKVSRKAPVTTQDFQCTRQTHRCFARETQQHLLNDES